MNKVKLLPKIKKLANHFGVQFRVGPDPGSVGIIADIPDHTIAAYCGEGVVFVRDKTRYCQEDMNIVLLHELGHAVLAFYKGGLKMSDWLEEVSCDHIALVWAAQLRLPVSTFMLKNFNKLNRGTHESKTNNAARG